MKTRKAKTEAAQSQMYVRLPAVLRDVLVDIAEKEGRSLNSLIVELLTEKVEALRAIEHMAQDDPLTAAWYAAESAEMYSKTIRGAIARYRRMESGDFDPNELILESAEPIEDIGEPISQLTPLQRELLDELSQLSPEKIKALRTLAKG